MRSLRARGFLRAYMDAAENCRLSCGGRVDCHRLPDSAEPTSHRLPHEMWARLTGIAIPFSKISPVSRPAISGADLRIGEARLRRMDSILGLQHHLTGGASHRDGRRSPRPPSREREVEAARWASLRNAVREHAPPPGSRQHAFEGAPCSSRRLQGPRTSPRSRLIAGAPRADSRGSEARRWPPRAIGRELGFAHTTVAREVSSARRTGSPRRRGQRAAERRPKPRAGKLERDFAPARGGGRHTCPALVAGAGVASPSAITSGRGGMRVTRDRILASPGAQVGAVAARSEPEVSRPEERAPPRGVRRSLLPDRGVAQDSGRGGRDCPQPEADSRRSPATGRRPVVGSDGRELFRRLRRALARRFLLMSRLAPTPRRRGVELAEMVSGLPGARRGDADVTGRRDGALEASADFSPASRSTFATRAPVAAGPTREHQRACQAVLPHGRTSRSVTGRRGGGRAGRAPTGSSREDAGDEPRRGDGGAMAGRGCSNHREFAGLDA